MVRDDLKYGTQIFAHCNQAGPVTNRVTSFLRMPALQHASLSRTIHPSKTARHLSLQSCCSNGYRRVKAILMIYCALSRPITSHRMVQMPPSTVQTTYSLRSTRFHMATRHGSLSLCATPEPSTRTHHRGSERNLRYIAAMHAQSLTISLGRRNLTVSLTSHHTRSTSPMGACVTQT